MSEEGKAFLIYATFPDVETAERICSHLVERRLIACANILPGMRSVFRWEGKVAFEGEVAALLKTVVERSQAAIEEGVRLHPYDTPAFVVLDVRGGHGPFLNWLKDETAA